MKYHDDYLRWLYRGGHIGTGPGALRYVRTACWIGVGVAAVAAIGLALPVSSRVRRMIYPAVMADGIRQGLRADGENWPMSTSRIRLCG